MGKIVVFSKENCSHCTEAKIRLNDLDIPFTELDVGSNLDNRMMMTVESSRHTVPQIFFNESHLGGAAELRALNNEEVKKLASQAIERNADPDFLNKEYTQEDLEQATLPLAAALEPYLPDDVSKLPETAPIIEFYTDFFGFLPNKFDYMSFRANSMALHMGSMVCNSINAELNLGRQYWTMMAATTALSAKCTYCSAHSIALTGEDQFEKMSELVDYINGRGPSLDELPFNDKEKAIINLTNKGTLGTLTTADIQKVHDAFGYRDLYKACVGVECVLNLMGSGNCFNDIIGFEVEASVKNSIENSAIAKNWDWGTHDTQDEENRHTFESKPKEVSFSKIKDRIFELNNHLYEEYEKMPDELLPRWITLRPTKDSIIALSGSYHCAYHTGDIDSGLKHLMGYAYASFKHCAPVAKEEARIALRTAKDHSAMQSKLSLVDENVDVLDNRWLSQLEKREALALELARAATNIPSTVNGSLALKLSKEFSPGEIIELSVALSLLEAGFRTTNLYKALSDWQFAN